MDEREQKYLDIIAQFPDSPLGHFSLGKYYVEIGRFQEAIAPLTHCVEADPQWAAAFLALGDAYGGVGNTEKAIATLEQARSTAHGKRDQSFIADIDERLEALRNG